MTDVTLNQQTVQESPKVVVLQIGGEAHFDNGRRIEGYFDEIVRSAEPKHVLLDLSGLTFASSAFFSSLLFWREEMVKRGGSLVLYGLRPEIFSTMRILTLDRVLTVRPDYQAAVESVSKA